MVSSKAVANYFLDVAKQNGASVTPTRMQVLLYFSHGWGLVWFGEPLLDETICAGEYGPVVTSVFYEFRKYGNRPIENYAREYDVNAHKSYAPRIPDDEELREFLGIVYGFCARYATNSLLDASHRAGTPWHETRNKLGWRRGMDISDKTMLRYFSRLAELA